MADELLRFVLLRIHPDTGVEEGVFAAAYRLRDNPHTQAPDRTALTDLLSWFETNLLTPQRFNRSKSKGHYRRKTAGISWFKSAAVEHVAQMHALAAVLDRYGFQVSEVSTDRPGYVVFEDEYQVVAEPFRGEVKRKRAATTGPGRLPRRA